MTTLLTDNLPLLSGAPNGIKKLRELILELAVRGKLVEQDASDEPACELIKSIAVEKTRLVTEGKIKKPKPLQDISEDEAPFKLPNGWQWVRLGEIADIIRGVTYGKSDASDSPLAGYAPLLRGNNINRVLNFDRPVFVPKKLIADHQYIQAGDIVIAMSSGSADLVGKAAQAETNFDGAFGAFCGVVRSRTSALFSFFGFFFQTPLYRLRAAGHGKGIGINNLQKTALESLEVPLPPLAEQHRIVAKVDELMALCDRLEAQQADAASAHAQLVQALLGSLTQASDATEFAASWQRLAEHFHTLFSTEPSIDALKQTLLQLAVMGKLVPQDPTDEPASELLQRIQAEKQRLIAEGRSRKQKELLTENIPHPPYGVPDGWEWEILDSILYITGGVTLGRKLAGREMVSKPYLRVANVQRGHLVLDVMKEVEVPEEEVSKYLLKNGDLLITEGGDWDKVGRTAVWRDELPECLHQNHVFRARALTDEFESRWAEMYLNSTTARDYFSGSSKQTTNLASINMTQLRACAFPVPPFAEQHRIVAKVDQLMALCDQLKTQLSQARQLNQQLASTLVEQAVA